MIFKAKTVRDMLKGTGWDRLEQTDGSFHEFLKKYGNYHCKFPAKLKRKVTYYELSEKSRQGFEFRVFQNGKTLDFYFMDPFENALCLAYDKNYTHKVEIFEYTQEPFSETIFLQTNLSILTFHFDDFNIFNMDGSRVENKDDLRRDKGYVAISKKTLAGSFRDESEETSFHIVIRYLCLTAQCILANR